LRIGDFYNTKVLFDSLTITYEPLVWDLNPEGIGVQPMIANITMGFKFIGGSDLSGPIARLQNAITFNFFANTGVYDDRNDRKKEKTESNKTTNTIIADQYEAMYNPKVYEMTVDGTEIKQNTVTEKSKTAADIITENVTKTPVKTEPVNSYVSKYGYIYNIINNPPKRWVKVIDKDSNLILETAPSFSATDEQLLLEAKLGLNDNI
jgi:hypothetical protein